MCSLENHSPWQFRVFHGVHLDLPSSKERRKRKKIPLVQWLSQHILWFIASSTPVGVGRSFEVSAEHTWTESGNMPWCMHLVYMWDEWWQRKGQETTNSFLMRVEVWGTSAGWVFFFVFVLFCSLVLRVQVNVCKDLSSEKEEETSREGQ